MILLILIIGNFLHIINEQMELFVYFFVYIIKSLFTILYTCKHFVYMDCLRFCIHVHIFVYMYSFLYTRVKMNKLDK